MSRQNVELFYRAMEAFNRRDLDALLAVMDDDVELVPRQVAMEGESSFRRHEGVRRWWNSVFDVFPDYTIEVGEVHDLEELMFASIRLRGHGSVATFPGIRRSGSWSVRAAGSASGGAPSTRGPKLSKP